jgi:hypothetical protein
MITKLDAAKRQLEIAIKLYFEQVDKFSCYALAAASREITDDLFAARRDEIIARELRRVPDPTKVRLSVREELKLRIRPEYLGDVMVGVRGLQNFLKHANKDPDGTIEEIEDTRLAVLLITAIRNYALLDQIWTPPMCRFFFWYAVKFPDHVDELDNRELEAAIRTLRREMNIIGEEIVLQAFLTALQQEAPHLFPAKAGLGAKGAVKLRVPPIEECR